LRSVKRSNGEPEIRIANEGGTAEVRQSDQ
jgi:hypothetical protein